MRKHLHALAILAITSLCMVGCKQTKYDYRTVKGDPLQTKIYTLPNGLKIYMTVNKEQPRIQTYIAVHAGSKHEPEETTGLAHYLEHMMFKGSSNLGTTDYESEKVLLDQIRDLYEVYRKTTDEAERAAIYHQIDSVSYAASAYFIPNEYDKVMAQIGSDGSNAYTSNDQTVYQEDIPSNEIENWAKVQSDRFKNMVLRGFHTELETVYEEYNKYLNNDWDKISTAILQTLTPTHPYNHSVIGYGDHLKNPSIKNIEAFFHTYYVPNNMAICLSGDFDPDNMVDIITKYFGDMEPNKDLKMPVFEPQPELTAVVEKEVVTPNPESVVMAWRLEGAASHQNDTLAVLSQVLHNGKAGLFDLDLNLPNKVVASFSMPLTYCDYSGLMLYAMPLPGQSLEELRGMLCQEVEKLRKGDFSDELVNGVITELKLQQQHQLEQNDERAAMYVDAFVNDVDWQDAVERTDRIAKLTKEDIVAFANRHITADNYVCVYKRTGEDMSVKPVAKPAITPIQMNRDTVSAFAKSIIESEVSPIEPVFVDLKNDIDHFTAKSDIPVLYKHNDLNNLFTLTFRYDMGSVNADQDGLNRYLPVATQYFELLGTDSLSAEQIQQKLYMLGCDMNLNAGMRTTELTLSGLQENMTEALRLAEHVMARLQPDSAALQGFVSTRLKERENALASFDMYAPYAHDYLCYGFNGARLTLDNEELKRADCKRLTALIQGLPRYQHRITYYGPMAANEVVKVVNDLHRVPETLQAVPAANPPALVQPQEDECFLLPYKGTKSFVMSQMACDGQPWDASKLALTRMYNDYFGAGMNTVVFQEMREKRSLCYGASARYVMPAYKDERCMFTTYIQSQNDKMEDCVATFKEITNDMPLSQTSFDVAKQGLVTQLRTQRTCREAVFGTYFRAERLGIDYDPDSLCYQQLQHVTLDDVQNFQQQNVRGLKYRTIIAGDPNAIDMSKTAGLGRLTVLDPGMVFGFTAWPMRQE